VGEGVRTAITLGVKVAMEVVVPGVKVEIRVAADFAVVSPASNQISSELTTVRPHASRSRAHTIFRPVPGSRCHSICSR